MITGSANLTRRNLANFNLETNVQVSAPVDSPALQMLKDHLDLIWHNRPGRQMSVDYRRYGEKSWLKRLLYRVQEATGMSTF